MEVKKLILGTSLKFTPIIIRNHIHMLITLVLFIIRLCAFLVKKATDVLLPVIRNDVEVLPVISTEGSYCAINVTNVGDYIDYEHTKSEIVQIQRTNYELLALAFQQDAIKNTNIFRLPVGPKKYYVSDSFRNAVLNNDLSGFRFDLVWSSNF